LEGRGVEGGRGALGIWDAVVFFCVEGLEGGAVFFALVVDLVVVLEGGTGGLAFALVSVVNLTCRTIIWSRRSRSRCRGRRIGSSKGSSSSNGI
jgi:hypothetical protein